MNKIIFVTFFFFFIFSSYTFAFPNPLNKRQGDGGDPMSGFKPCEEGKTYPITFTKLKLDPNPIVLGKPLTTTVVGKSTVTIEEGATCKTEAFLDGVPLFTKEEDACKDGECPHAPGDFDFSSTETPPASPEGPFNTTLTVNTKFQMFNADKTELACLEGPFSMTFP